MQGSSNHPGGVGLGAPGHDIAASLPLLWRSAKHWTLALAVAAFPFLFIVDHAIETRLSPVLPGLALLALIIIGLPFPIVERLAKKYRKHDAKWQARNSARHLQWARAASGVALVWLGLWFAVGT